MANNEESPHGFTAWGYSDDCAGLSGSKLKDGSEPTEYQEVDRWFEMVVEGKVVGKCRMSYGDRTWSFEYEGDIEICAGKALLEIAEDD